MSINTTRINCGNMYSEDKLSNNIVRKIREELLMSKAELARKAGHRIFHSGALRTSAAVPPADRSVLLRIRQSRALAALPLLDRSGTRRRGWMGILPKGQ